LLAAFAWSAVAGIATLTRPISFCRAVWPGTPTVDSAKAIVFDVPSIIRAIDLDCWNANNPAVGFAAKLGAEVGRPTRTSVVGPIEAK
jgi:hypothetical protein